jgi:heptosyltransferase-2
MAKAIDKPTFTIYSPFIKKESWNSFENMDKHESIHLKDCKPDLYNDNSRAFLKTVEKEPLAYYNQLTVDMIWRQLQPYLQKTL